MSELPVLLAPVPVSHLEDGQQVCRANGEVAFGSRAFDVFLELDALRGGRQIKAYIYASHEHRTGGAKATWQATYVRWEKALLGGSHPDPERYRPPSTWSEDGQGYWLLFWHVTDLHPLPTEEHVWTHHFRDRKHGRRASKPYAPEGPMIKLYP
jgi:hypothetical protein